MACRVGLDFIIAKQNNAVLQTQMQSQRVRYVLPNRLEYIHLTKVYLYIWMTQQH